MPQATPQRESRVKKTLLNARVNLIFYFLTLCLSFFSRKIFLDCLGADFVGLTGTLQNLLGFLNLAELGIGSAIGYVLYKPLFDHDQTKINEIISVMGYLYRWIGLVIFGCGLILACFLPLIFPNKDTGFHLPLIYCAYFAFLASSLIGYFINYRQNLLGADQRNYVVTGYFQTMTIVKTIIQMALAYYTGSYYLWIVIELSFGILYSFILNWKINQTYPWLRADTVLGKSVLRNYPEVITKTKQLFIHQINSFIQFQTTPILTYAFTSLQIVAYLGNYTLIIDKLCSLMNTVLGSAAAGVGNLIAEGNKEHIISIFWQITVIRVFIAGVFIFGCICSFNSFLTIWLGKEYLLSFSVLMLLLAKIYTQISTGAIHQFVYGYGLFRDVWSSILQSIIFIFGAIIGGQLWGINGILFAAFLSIFLISAIWKPYYLFSSGFKISTMHYWKQWIILNMINAFAILLSFLINKHIFTTIDKSFFSWGIHTILQCLIYTTVSTILFIIFSKNARSIISKFVFRLG